MTDTNNNFDMELETKPMDDLKVVTANTPASEIDREKLLKLVRQTPQFAGGPTTASVPYSEVYAYIAGGWSVADMLEALAGSAPRGRQAALPVPTHNPLRPGPVIDESGIPEADRLRNAHLAHPTGADRNPGPDMNPNNPNAIRMGMTNEEGGAVYTVAALEEAATGVDPVDPTDEFNGGGPTVEGVPVEELDKANRRELLGANQAVGDDSDIQTMKLPALRRLAESKGVKFTPNTSAESLRNSLNKDNS